MEKTNKMPETYGEALKQGWQKTHAAWQRGYVSRKIDVNNQPIKLAGGFRHGQFYVNLPSWGATQYCLRQYIAKD